MELLKFKTNLTDQEAVNKVAPLLDEKKNISKWQVDPESDGNILSISGQNLDPQQIQNAVEQAGFTAEPVRIMGIGGNDL